MTVPVKLEFSGYRFLVRIKLFSSSLTYSCFSNSVNAAIVIIGVLRKVNARATLASELV